LEIFRLFFMKNNRLDHFQHVSLLFFFYQRKKTNDHSITNWKRPKIDRLKKNEWVSPMY